AFDDGSWCRSRGSADLSRNRRCTCPLQELQGGGGGVWTDTLEVSIGRERPQRADIAVRRRDDADDALRSGPEHAGAFGEMVLAQGLGDEDCQASRNEEGDRRPGASAGRDPANPAYRGNISSRGPISAISAINFLMSKLPKELKSFATTTKAPGPPITLSR